MTLNANEVTSSSRVFENIPIGAYPARVVGIVGLGEHARSFAGQDKDPCPRIAVTFELLDEFLKDEDGQEQLDKPRHLTRELNLFNIDVETADSTKWINAMDPGLKVTGGDWAKAINLPVTVGVVHNESKGKTYDNVGAVTSMREKEAAKAPPLVNTPYVFDFDSPDMEVYDRLPEFMKTKIKKSLRFEGSVLQDLIGGETSPDKSEESDDNPY